MNEKTCYRSLKKIKNPDNLRDILGEYSYREYICDKKDKNSCQSKSTIDTSTPTCWIKDTSGKEIPLQANQKLYQTYGEAVLEGKTKINLTSDLKLCYRQIKKIANSETSEPLLGKESYREYPCITIDSDTCSNTSTMLDNKPICYLQKNNELLEITPEKQFYQQWITDDTQVLEGVQPKKKSLSSQNLNWNPKNPNLPSIPTISSFSRQSFKNSESKSESKSESENASLQNRLKSSRSDTKSDSDSDLESDDTSNENPSVKNKKVSQKNSDTVDISDTRHSEKENFPNDNTDNTTDIDPKKDNISFTPKTEDKMGWCFLL